MTYRHTIVGNATEFKKLREHNVPKMHIDEKCAHVKHCTAGTNAKSQNVCRTLERQLRNSGAVFARIGCAVIYFRGEISHHGLASAKSV